MKRKTLTTAVLAGLTGMAGMVSVSNAVNLNPDGLGQVLLYPYYTARGGNDTFISIVNTTDNAKSVKVRFLEALNSREVLDFNLYLSAFDVWVAAITQTDAGGGQILIPDSSCTVPYFFGNDELADGETELNRLGSQEFVTRGFDDDGGPTNLDRTLSGYVEVIEMGTLTNDLENSANAATHVLTSFPGLDDQISRPANCDQLVAAWTQNLTNPALSGYWIGPGNEDIDHDTPSGGLFGAGTIINVGDGTMFSYNAEAIDAFSTAILHTDPGSIFPNLNSGDTTSNVFINGIVDQRTWMSGVEAVSATVLYDTIMNEYIIDPDIAAQSEWVVNFPTKRFYVDQPFAIDIVPVAPFTVPFSGACSNNGEPAAFDFWDREEAPANPIIIPPIISPPPDEPGTDQFTLCWEANVIRVGGDPDATETEILGEVNFTTFPLGNAGFTSGWLRFDFGDKSTRPTEDGAVVYNGLPTIGFWVNTFTNGQLGGGSVLANYGGTFRHRGSRSLSLASAPAPVQ